jgi:hypothetical protein
VSLEEVGIGNRGETVMRRSSESVIKDEPDHRGVI